MVLAILALRPSLLPAPDELRKRVQSIRVRSAQETRGLRSPTDGEGWRQKHVQIGARNDTMSGRWRSSGSQSPQNFRFTNTSPHSPSSPVSPVPATPLSALSQLSGDRSPKPIPRVPSFQATSPPARYVSRFHNGSKIGDDQILNTVILNKLNVFSVKTYDDVKQFLFQILGSDQKEFVREFTWLVFRKAAAEEKFCGLFAKLLAEIQKEHPVILEEMRNLHTTYLDIWDVSESSDTKVDRRCRLGYSQFLAELTALGILESDTMKTILETLKRCIVDCLPHEHHQGTVDEYMDCLKQLCGSKVPRDVRLMIRKILVTDMESWIADSIPGLSNKSRFACMDLRDLLMKAI